MNNICRYCNFLGQEDDFCNNCGMPLSISINECDDEKVGEWQNCDLTLNCTVIESDLELEDLIHGFMDFIEIPIYLYNNKAYFLQDKILKNLSDYIEIQELDFNKIKIIMDKIFDIFSIYEEKGLIISSMSLSDFWMQDDDLSTLKFRQIRRTFEEGSFNKQKQAEIIAPEIENGVMHKINSSSNVYLLGQIFLKLILKNYNIKGRAEEKYFSYYLKVFCSDVPLELHDFILGTTDVFIENRYPSISVSKDVFINAIIRNEKTKGDSLHLSIFGNTDVGRGKLQKSLRKKNTVNERINEDDFNEDAFYYDSFNDENKFILAVADGVSTARYGSGKQASTLLIKNIRDLWNNHKSELNNKEDIERVLNNAVATTNNEIAKIVENQINIEKQQHENSDEYIEQVTDIMATTLVVAIVIDGIMYYSSIGDSKIYIYINEIGLNLMNVEDNIGNMKLKDGQYWKDVNKNEEKSVLTKFVGGVRLDNEIITNNKTELKVEKFIIGENDLIILCSDGVTDFMLPLEDEGDLWKLDNMMKTLINSNNVEDLPKAIIDKANENGGGDNITVLVATSNKII